MSSRSLITAALITICVFGMAPDSRAEKGDMKLRFGLLGSVPTDKLDDPTDPAELDPALGYQASFEYVVTGLLGVEPAISGASYEGKVTNANPLILDRDVEVDLFMLTANLNFHLLGGKSVDLFVGPTLGYAFWGDITIENTPAPFPTEDRFVYGLNLGVDVMFGSKKKWGFNAAVNYLVADFEIEGGTQDFGVNPVQIKAGAVFKF